MIGTACPCVLDSQARQSAAPLPVKITVTAAAHLDEDAAVSSLASWLLQLAECEEADEQQVTY